MMKKNNVLSLIIILIAIWPITVISGILAVFAGFALLIADRLKNKKS